MRNDYHLAVKLRKKGASYGKISKELGIPKSTMHYWFKDLKWSNVIKKELTEKAVRVSRRRMRKIAKANKDRWAKWRANFRLMAVKEFPKLKNKQLFTSGIMLYWGEGDQNLKNEVRLTNTDSRIISLFYGFLKNICGINNEDIYIYLIIYPDLSDEKCKNFWSIKTGIALNQFNKTQIIYGRHPTKRLENGICTIRVRRSRWLKEKILVWVNMMSKELTKKMRV